MGHPKGARRCGLACVCLLAIAALVVLFDDLDQAQPNVARLSALSSSVIASKGTASAAALRSLLLYRLPCDCMSAEDAAQQAWEVVELPKATRILNFWAFEAPPRAPENSTGNVVWRMENDARCFSGRCGVGQHLCCIPTVDGKHVSAPPLPPPLLLPPSFVSPAHLCPLLPYTAFNQQVASWAACVMLLLLLAIPVPMLFCPPPCRPCHAMGAACGCRYMHSMLLLLLLLLVVVLLLLSSGCLATCRTHACS